MPPETMCPWARRTATRTEYARRVDECRHQELIDVPATPSNRPCCFYSPAKVTMTSEILQAKPLTPVKPTSWLRQVFPAILTAASAIRMVVVYFYYRQLPDADQYYEQFGWEVGWVARALASGHGFSSPVYPITGPTAMVPPLYTFLLAGIFKLFGIYSLTSGFIILTLNSLFSSLNCIAVYFSAAYSLGQRAARIAAWSWALYPFAIYFSADRVWEYSLTSLLITTCFCIAQRLHTWPDKLDGMARLRRALRRHRALQPVSPVALSISAVAGRVECPQGRQALAGEYSDCRGHFGGRHDSAVDSAQLSCAGRDLSGPRRLLDQHLRRQLQQHVAQQCRLLESIRASAPAIPRRCGKFLTMGEIPYLREKHILAAEWIRQHPLGYACAVLRRAVYYWTGYWSLQREYLDIEPTEIPMMFYICGVTLLALRGIRRFWKWNRAAGLPYFALVGIFPISYCLSLVLVDYRQPIEPAIVVLAVAGALPFKRATDATWIGAERALGSPAE